MILLREATLDDLSTLLEFEKRLIEYERDFTPNLKKSDFNYYNLKSYIKDPEISVVVAEEKNKIIASGYALIRENKTYKIPDKLIFLGFMYVIPEYRGKGINKKIAQEYGYSSKQENIHWSKIWALYILKLRLGKN